MVPSSATSTPGCALPFSMYPSTDSYCLALMIEPMANDNDGLYLPAGSTADGDWDLVITPESAGWGYSSLRVITLSEGQHVEFGTGDSEWIVLPLTGGVDVTLGGQTLALAGRPGVFTAVTDTAYLPIDSTVTLTGTRAGEIALCGARADRALPFRYQPAAGVDVSLRGSGSHTRQVNNFGMVPDPQITARSRRQNVRTNS